MTSIDINMNVERIISLSYLCRKRRSINKQKTLFLAQKWFFFMFRILRVMCSHPYSWFTDCDCNILFLNILPPYFCHSTWRVGFSFKLKHDWIVKAFNALNMVTRTQINMFWLFLYVTQCIYLYRNNKNYISLRTSIHTSFWISHKPTHKSFTSLLTRWELQQLH